ncbi:MAG: M20/M25/M40 family metallo-hydrolase, partial [Bacilli bacterium]|nr:M20/M25/M40 family metallo-hydrolase [Bacilli bacterium]
MIFANLWLFSGLLDALCKKNGGELNALMRTTMAFTQMEGSKANNVIPPVAKMGINSRLMVGENSDGAIAYVKKVIKNDQIEVKKIQTFEPSRISEVDCPAYETLEKAIRLTWDDVLVSPYLMIACSDSRHYGKISGNVYRFSAMALSSEERKSIHGNNEKIPLETIKKTVEFYLRLMQMC